MNRRTSQQFGAIMKSVFKNTLLAFWLLTLPASGFAPLFYSTQSAVVSESNIDSDSGQPAGADAEATPKKSVQFWLIAGASPAGNLSTLERSKKLLERLEVAVCATGQANWSSSESSASNRTAILKTAEFTLLGLKPSGVS